MLNIIYIKICDDKPFVGTGEDSRGSNHRACQYFSRWWVGGLRRSSAIYKNYTEMRGNGALTFAITGIAERVKKGRKNLSFFY
jgi:hypothetical protein